MQRSRIARAIQEDTISKSKTNQKNQSQKTLQLFLNGVCVCVGVWVCVCVALGVQELTEIVLSLLRAQTKLTVEDALLVWTFERKHMPCF